MARTQDVYFVGAAIASAFASNAYEWTAAFILIALLIVQISADHGIR